MCLTVRPANSEPAPGCQGPALQSLCWRLRHVELSRPAVGPELCTWSALNTDAKCACPASWGGRGRQGVLDDLVGRPLFLALYDYFRTYGGVYKLAFGPKTFMICSDPVVVKHILRTANLSFDKGVLAEILEPIMGKGLIPADFETWKTRRRAIVPGFHSAWLNHMARARAPFPPGPSFPALSPQAPIPPSTRSPFRRPFSLLLHPFVLTL